MKKLDGGFREEAHAGAESKHIADYESTVEILRHLESGLPGIFDKEMVLAGAEARKLNAPGTETGEGSVRGAWNGSIFVLDDNYVPEKYNDSKSSIAEIKKSLSDRFGMQVDGIPYVDGIADFSGISVAHIATSDIVKKATGMTSAEYSKLTQTDRSRVFQEAFSDASDGKSKRNRNFDYADQLAAEKHIPIPGLSDGYSASDLKKWRTENKFSWDEQVNSGYNLVPTVIHGNLSHTGLVSTSRSAFSYLDSRKKDMAQNPGVYCWDEKTAPISIDELVAFNHTISRERGGRNMAMRRVLSKGMNLGRHGEVGYDELHKETGEQVSEGDRLHELGAKFEEDKTKLEDAIERVQASSIKPEDKAKMIAELNAAIDALQAQYEDDVVAEEAKVQEEIEGQLEQMDQTIDELTEQADSLRDVTMDAASTDASAAAEAADAKKQEFEQMKEEYTEKLRLQMEQAEMQQRNIRNRRLSGR